MKWFCSPEFCQNKRCELESDQKPTRCPICGEGTEWEPDEEVTTL